MTGPATAESTQSPEPEINIIEWTTEGVMEAYVGRLAYVPSWKESDTGTHSPYVKDTLHLVSGAEILEDDSIVFLMTKLEPDETSYDPKKRSHLVARIGPPKEIVMQKAREIWVYGDRSEEDDQTLSFSLT